MQPEQVDIVMRDQPPVAPIELPQRLSQTLLGRANVCKRSAWLYITHDGGAPAHELHFGTAIHAVIERILTDLIVSGEPTLYAAAEGEDPVAAQRAVSSLTAAIVDEVLAEHPELTVPIVHPTHSVDHLREQAFHFAVASDIGPDTVLGLEQRMRLTLPSGITVSGRVDVLRYLTTGLYGVDDIKSTFAAQSEGEFEDSWQGKLYAAMVAFGQPFDADGEPMPKLEGVQFVQAREVYPRLAPRDDRLRSVAAVYSRQQLSDWLPDLDWLARDFAARAETGDFPAVPGSHCSSCAAPDECPLPASLRRHAGTINTHDDAAEAAEWIEVTKPRVSATEREIKAFAKAHGPVRYGRDKVREFVEQESFDTDWPALERGVAEAVQFGVAFDLADYRKRRVSNRFVSRKLAPAELGDETEVLTDEERYGADAPF